MQLLSSTKDVHINTKMGGKAPLPWPQPPSLSFLISLSQPKAPIPTSPASFSAITNQSFTLWALATPTGNGSV